MRPSNLNAPGAALGTLAALLTAGCSSTVVRENILSSVETGIGISIAENHQTQLYEVRAGYIRSQFYSIPTGKLVHNTNAATAVVSGPGAVAANAQISNAADVTPAVVSGIRMHTGWESLLLGMDVSENFAVGNAAVMSPAAVAMYVAGADSKEKAQAAAQAAGRTFTPQVMDSMGQINQLHQTGTSDQQKAIDEAVQGGWGKNWGDFVRSSQPADWQELGRILSRRGILKP